MLHAHPLEDSFSRALRDVVTDALHDGGVEHQVSRLAQGEMPDLDGTPVDRLVVVAPTWWGGPPAVLLDWLQRTLGPHVDARTPSVSPLAAVRGVSVVTTHGGSRFVNRMQGEPGRQTWKRVVAPHCGPNTTFDWLALYKIDRSTPEERAAFIERVRAHFTSAAASS